MLTGREQARTLSDQIKQSGLEFSMSPKPDYERKKLNLSIKYNMTGQVLHPGGGEIVNG